MVKHGDFLSDDSRKVHFTRNDDDELLGILLVDAWYDRIIPFYNYAEIAAQSVAIKSAPEAFEKVSEILEGLVVEFGFEGWVFGISLLYLAKRWVKKGISVRPFEYAGRAYGQGIYGPSLYGEGYEVLEFPVNS